MSLDPTFVGKGNGETCCSLSRSAAEVKIEPLRTRGVTESRDMGDNGGNASQLLEPSGVSGLSGEGRGEGCSSSDLTRVGGV